MNRTTKSIALSVMMAFASLAASAAELTGVTFLFTDGTKATFAFAEKPALSLTAEGCTVTATGKDAVTYTLSSVKKFYFDEDAQTGISQVESAQEGSAPVFTYANGTVSVSGLKAGELVNVYSVGGGLVAGAKADASGSASADISGSAAGVYVVSAGGGVSFKLLKK